MAATPSPTISWVRGNGFLLGLVLAVIAAFVFPGPGSRGGALQPELVCNAGIALILFLQGLSLAVEKVRAGAANWRLHVVIQAFTFVVFPLVGLLLDRIVPALWQSQPHALRQGFLYLCVLPSTISTSVVFTAVARGNTPGALFNAALSNILGVIVTPLLVHLLMKTTGGTGSLGPLLLKIVLLTLLPFGLGMALRPLLKDHVDRRKPWIARISNAIILFFVYTAFCDSVAENIWGRYGLLLTLQTIAVVVLLFLGMSLLTGAACRALALNREDAIAAYFCSVKKTLAMGVPLAMLIFGESGDLSLILLPVMFYHQIQLFANGLMANRWAKRA